MKTKRKYLTPKQKKQLLKEQDWLCLECREPFTEGDPAIYDHKQALIDGGTNDWDNWRAIHRDKCHKPKTKIEQQNNAKVKRIQNKLNGVKPKWKRKIGSRGFDKTSKRKIQTKSKRQIQNAKKGRSTPFVPSPTKYIA